jgi:hypothetical protein
MQEAWLESEFETQVLLRPREEERMMSAKI